MKRFLVAVALASVFAAPASFAQNAQQSNQNGEQPGAVAAKPASGGAAGERAAISTNYVLAGVGVAAVVGGAFALANSGGGDDGDNVPAGGTGTTGTTGTR